MKNYIVAALATFSIFTARAQNGQISGNIATTDGRNIPAVKVYALGVSDTVTTDVEGHYHLSLPAGTYHIVYSSQDFQEESDSVNVIAGSEIYINKTLSTVKQIIGASIKVGRVIKDQGSTAWAVQSKQLSTQVSEAIGAQEISRTTAKNTGDVIKRIPGATIMDGKFANIRGMYDRYNASYLNGAPLPSTESDRKAFSFDIIPASLLDNIVVIKSGTPDLTGDFGGGIIRINTKNIPDKLTQNISLGFQYNSITSFRDVQSFNSSASEYFGLPGRNRQIPTLEGNLMHSNAEVNARESKKFNNDWKLSNTSPMPTPRFSYTIGVPFKLKHQREIGLLMSVNYSLTQKYSDGEIYRNDLSDNRPLSSFNDKLFSSNVQNGGIMNLSLKLNDRNRIDWKNLYTINYDASTTLRTGMSNHDDQIRGEGYSNLVNYNRLMSTQWNGTHILGSKQNTLTWLVNYGNTNREIPDFRIAQYAIIESGERYLILNDFFNAGSGRFFSDLNENTFSASAEMKHTFEQGKLLTNLKYGAFSQIRNRSFASREFVYGPMNKVVESNNTPEVDLSQEKISNSGLYLIEKTSTDLDQYTGTSNLNAGFIMVENHYPLFYTNKKANSLKVIYGVRLEQFSKVLRNEIFTNIYKKDVSNTGVSNDILPSINVIAPLTRKTGIRLAYYKTLNRPEMREMAPFTFYNFNLNSEIVGNTSLQRAILHNADFRFEIFPGKEDMLSIGGFAKRILNPIEFSLDPTQPQIRTFTYRNEKSAQIVGAELELRKKLDFLGVYFANGLFKNLSLYGNFALIQSKVQFNQNSTGVTNRPLQGQSPYVANVSLFYDDAKSGWTASVNFNKIGARIAYIGVPQNIQPFGGDIYEFGRSILDVQIAKQLGKSGSIKLTAGDLFSQQTAYYQDLNKDGKYQKGTDNTLFGFTNGRTLTISYGYSF